MRKCHFKCSWGLHFTSHASEILVMCGEWWLPGRLIYNFGFRNSCFKRPPPKKKRLFDCPQPTDPPYRLDQERFFFFCLFLFFCFLFGFGFGFVFCFCFCFCFCFFLVLIFVKNHKIILFKRFKGWSKITNIYIKKSSGVLHHYMYLFTT